MQAEALHREVAFLSNELHQYADHDTVGVKPSMDAILQKRQEWREVRKKIEHIDKFGTLPEEKTKSEANYTADEKATMAELQVQLTNCQNLIRNKRHKIKNNPDGANSQRWAEELAILMLQENELKSTIIIKKYEKS